MTDHRTKPMIYIAGPYTSPYPIYNVREALQTAEVVAKLGATPIVPHLTMMWDLIEPHPYEFWMALDEELLRVCDAMYRFPGKSSGADQEESVALDLGIPVFNHPKDEADIRAFILSRSSAYRDLQNA